MLSNIWTLMKHEFFKLIYQFFTFDKISFKTSVIGELELWKIGIGAKMWHRLGSKNIYRQYNFSIVLQYIYRQLHSPNTKCKILKCSHYKWQCNVTRYARAHWALSWLDDYPVGQAPRYLTFFQREILVTLPLVPHTQYDQIRS